jgi:Flp pilus assembly protein TadG
MVRKVCPGRRGAALIELVLLLPFLLFLFVIAVDWARVFYCSLIVNNCARNGAFYASDLYATTQSPYASMTDAALADASNLQPQPTVTSSSGSDSYGPYVSCTVSYSFQTLTNFPGVPQSTPIVCTVRVYQAPKLPN